MPPRREPVREGAVLVLEGSINPGIFTPHWLASVGLVRPDVAGEAKIGFIDPELSRFEIAGMTIEARRDQVTIASQETLAAIGSIGDFAVQIFMMLPHTPVIAIGMNRVAHWPMKRPQVEALWKRFVPDDPWRDVLGPVTPRTLTVGSSGDRPRDQSVEITLEPSALLNGAYIVAARRLQRPRRRRAAPDTAEWALAALQREWHQWMTDARAIIGHVAEGPTPTGRG